MIFAIQGVPRKWSLGFVKNQFEPEFPGLFQPKYFEMENKFKKTVFIKLLSDHQEPIDIVKAINSIPKYKHMKLKAIIPKYVSPVYMNAASKNGKKFRVKKSNRSSNITRLDEILVITHREIMTELQAKYTKLYNLSRKTGTELLERIARIIFERLNHIAQTNGEASSTCFKLSSCYRKLHPHFGDFQLILSTLHKIQDEQGAPRQQLAEADVSAPSRQLNMIDNIPFDKIKSATVKYSMKITKRVLEHIRNLDSESHQMDSPEDAARKKVRKQLKNMVQHLPAMIRQVIQFNLTPEKAPFHRVRIYGEPFLPCKETMVPFTRRFKAVHIIRSDRMYNLLKMNIPPAQFASLMAKDGASIGGAKLVIRSSDIPLHRVSDNLTKEMRAACGVKLPDEYPLDVAMDL